MLLEPLEMMKSIPGGKFILLQGWYGRYCDLSILLILILKCELGLLAHFVEVLVMPRVMQ